MEQLGGQWEFQFTRERGPREVLVSDNKGNKSFYVDPRLRYVLRWLQEKGLPLICRHQNDIRIANSGASGIGNVFEQPCDAPNLNGMFIKIIISKAGRFSGLQRIEIENLGLLQNKGLLGVDKNTISPFINYIYGWITDGSPDSKQLSNSESSVSKNLLQIHNFHRDYTTIRGDPYSGIPYAITLGERLTITWEKTMVSLGQLKWAYIINQGDLRGNVFKHGDNLEYNILKFIFCIASGLKDLNEKNLIHNDIKPDNIAGIYSDSEGYIWKIIDLGLISEGKESQGGTSPFMDTHVFNEQYVSQQDMANAAKKDIFALGISVLGILGGNLNNIINELQRGNLPCPFLLSSLLSRGLSDIIYGMLIKSRSRRLDANQIIEKCLELIKRNPIFR